MSRKRKKKQYVVVQPSKKQEKQIRYIVSLAEWKEFELFKNIRGEIGHLLKQIQDEWEKTATYQPSLFELVKKLYVFLPKKNKNEKIGNRPPKGSFMQMAEIIIQEIEDEF